MIEQPFKLDSTGHIYIEKDEVKIINARLAQLILTRGYYEDTIGEMPWDIYFGSGVPLMLHKKGDSTIIDQTTYYIKQAIKKYMPELYGVSVSATLAQDKKTKGIALLILIEWKKSNLSGKVALEV